MKITVKVRAGVGKAPESVVRDRLQHLQCDAVVEELFPGEKSGRRAGLVIVDLPDNVSDEILEQLRQDEHIEYAERASSRKATS